MDENQPNGNEASPRRNNSNSNIPSLARSGGDQGDVHDAQSTSKDRSDSISSTSRSTDSCRSEASDLRASSPTPQIRGCCGICGLQTRFPRNSRFQRHLRECGHPERTDRCPRQRYAEVGSHSDPMARSCLGDMLIAEME